MQKFTDLKAHLSKNIGKRFTVTKFVLPDIVGLHGTVLGTVHHFDPDESPDMKCHAYLTQLNTDKPGHTFIFFPDEISFQKEEIFSDEELATIFV